jgi:hypothetical protein
MKTGNACKEQKAMGVAVTTIVFTLKLGSKTNNAVETSVQYVPHKQGFQPPKANQSVCVSGTKQMQRHTTLLSQIAHWTACVQQPFAGWGRGVITVSVSHVKAGNINLQS